METPPTQHDPLDTPEKAVALLLKVFHRQADDILQGNGDLENDKKKELQTLCDGLKSNMGKIRAEHFPYAAGGVAPDDPGPNRAISALVCCNNYSNCIKAGRPPQQCENDYVVCMSHC